ncbi:hypothetical protein EVAR_36159_1 [Eumeta japonica]|uniref:Uncharacterized protein n=1 Tax=Eumeta variegata TaxID=151549 RepID=A0A4C1X5E7_EUMVA|nr:hypothetical protein EVAR_36159_1 [Eumeta japonica]
MPVRFWVRYGGEGREEVVITRVISSASESRTCPPAHCPCNALQHLTREQGPVPKGMRRALSSATFQMNSATKRVNPPQYRCPAPAPALRSAYQIALITRGAPFITSRPISRRVNRRRYLRVMFLER